MTLLKELEDTNFPRDQAEVLLRVIQQSQALDRLVSKETFDHRIDRLETKFDALPNKVMVDVLKWLLPLNLVTVIGVLGLTGKAIALLIDDPIGPLARPKAGALTPARAVVHPLLMEQHP